MPIIFSFGKAVNMANTKVYHLLLKYQDNYRNIHDQIAPELVHDAHKKSTASDVDSFVLLISLVCKYYWCEPLCNWHTIGLKLYIKKIINQITYTFLSFRQKLKMIIKEQLK